VKFLAFGQWRIERTGQGILGFITNHAYLDNPTFRGMRQSLMSTFTDIYILNLHGNAKKKEVAPDGGKDENVFDIQQGVAICILVKEPGKTGPVTVHYADLWGHREGKYQALAETDINRSDWKELKPSSPFYLFVTRNETDLDEYMQGWKVTDIFPVNGVGMTTARDHVVIDYEAEPLVERATLFRDSQDSNAVLCEKLKIPQKLGWNISRARELILQEKDLAQHIKPVLYRPFDKRLIFYHDSLVWRTVKQVMRHMLAGENLGLIVPRQVVSDFRHVLCTSRITNFNTLDIAGRFGSGCLFPLYLYPVKEKEQPDKSGGKEGGVSPIMAIQTKREPNLNPEFIKAVSEKLGLKFVEDGKGDLAQTFGPEDIFNYAYAVFHSPAYRSRYAEFLRIDFPRLPLTSNRALFRALAGKGATLVALHLMESPLLNNLITRYPIAGSNTVEKVIYEENTHRVYINKTQYFEGVSPEVWNFHIGGYQVGQKWLKDRKGRALTYDELTHYQKVIVALKETIRLMTELDALIPGWPVG
jgi:predicted helicase